MRLSIITLLIFVTFMLWGCSVADPDAEGIESPNHPQQTLPSESNEVIAHATLNIEVPVYDTASETTFAIPVQNPSDSPISCTYLHFGTRVRVLHSDNVFLACTDETEMNQGSHYAAYIWTDSGPQALGAFQFSKDIQLDGNIYHIEFEYSVHDDQLIFTHVPTGNQNPLEFKLKFAFDQDTCLVQFLDGAGIYRHVILNLQNQEAADLFAGLDQSDLGEVFGDQISDFTFIDSTRFLIKLSNGSHFYIDATNHTVCKLDNLIGEEIEGCSVVGKNIVCWSTTKDFWRIQTADLATSLLLSAEEASFVDGIWQKNGCSFVIYKKNSIYHVFDFETEASKEIALPDGWQFLPKDIVPSPDGRKFYVADQNADGVKQLLIFDCDKTQFTELKRANPNDITERTIGWTEKNTIAISSETGTDYYIYSLDFT